ncbi:class I SAM-dependent methyltransferase [Papillibacter cinnamivorans]|uniref:Methyltransferase domain-containing protein n=1 Tax=Papillibacter cinnamivorans DSM 12816 TaxID=1122930 RepID=A0A1W2C0C3_9FIRM|nr:methyltransferase domain-containing protein [Papillibacter cinnamivorans]SMC78454.1 Methyltransferase domain-containing protein [Papillibacter cinnamivorans DSM 12816]
MNERHMRFDAPGRVKELDPEATLKRIGLRDGGVFCDIGAGSGVFTVPAARITKNKVYALELNDAMLSVIREKAEGGLLSNIEAKKVTSEDFFMEDHSVDIALMATVLHEITDKAGFLGNVKKMLKADGRAAVIEFHKRATPMGPPVTHRIDQADVTGWMRDAGLPLLEQFDLGENFYCLVFGQGGQNVSP